MTLGVLPISCTLFQLIPCQRETFCITLGHTYFYPTRWGHTGMVWLCVCWVEPQWKWCLCCACNWGDRNCPPFLKIPSIAWQRIFEPAVPGPSPHMAFDNAEGSCVPSTSNETESLSSAFELLWKRLPYSNPLVHCWRCVLKHLP